MVVADGLSTLFRRRTIYFFMSGGMKNPVLLRNGVLTCCRRSEERVSLRRALSAHSVMVPVMRMFLILHLLFHCFVLLFFLHAGAEVVRFGGDGQLRVVGERPKCRCFRVRWP